MRNLKKVLSLSLALVMLLGMMVVGAGAATTYTDANDINYTEAVDVMSAVGVFSGTDKGDFQPNGDLTREQAAKIITYMLMGQDAADKLTAAKAPYKDVAANRWSAGSIAYCTTMNIIAGDGNGAFYPTQTVNGYAFAKMLLVALGYDPAIQNYTGSSWAINVSKDALAAGLTAGLDVSLANTLTREQAAQMAFNTLKADMVYYTNKGTEITTDGMSVVVGASAPEKVVNLAGTDYRTGSTDAYVQFCEQYAKNLKLVSGTPDAAGRPSNLWKYGVTEVGTYATAPTYTYTAEVSKEAMARTLKGYTAETANMKATENNQGKTAITGSGDQVLDTDAIAGLTGAGVVVEIYTTGTEVTNVVVLTTTLAEVSRVTTTSGKESVTLSNRAVAEKKENGKNSAFYAELSELAVKDQVLVVMDATNTDTIISLAMPETVTGTFTKIVNGKYTVGGTEYAGTKGAALANLAADNLGKTVTLTLDTYGNVIAAELGENATAKNAAYLLGVSRDGTAMSGYTYNAKLLFIDGTVEWVQVSKLNDKTAKDADNTFDTYFTTSTNKDTFVLFAEENGSYALNTTTTSVGATTEIDGQSITKDTIAIKSGVNASNATVFLIQNENGTYSVYTGIKNVPTTSVTYGDALVKDTFASVVVVSKGTATAAAADYVFIYDNKIVSTELSGTQAVNYYNAIVNGEFTTVAVSSDLATSLEGKDDLGLYVNNTYTGDYISALGTKASSASAETSVKGAADPDTVKLVNGVLTVAGMANPYVVTNDFAAYDIDLTGANVSAVDLTLNSTENTDYAHSGDYVVVVLDKDGKFATAAYCVNVANS